ncbi:MAG: hypothetical protein AAF597_14375 [Bacteroidota bacterium]
MKKVLIAGSTGMVGGIIQNLCLADEGIGEVISLVRRSSGTTHIKLKEIILPDFADYGPIADAVTGVDAAFFCIGVYTGQVPDDVFKTITLDYAVAFGKALEQHSPQATLCLLSGQGADRTEQSRVAFAKYKGMSENQLSALSLGAFHSFRPGYIYPVTPRNEPNLMYRVSRWLYPVIRLMGRNTSIKSTELAQAMVKVGLHGTDQEVLENAEILGRL